MAENKTSVTAAVPPGQDPGARARDQLGAFFFVLAAALSCGAVVAARDSYGSFLSHAVWWWVGWALLMLTPALMFNMIPWAMRSVFGQRPRGPVEDATRAFYMLLGFSFALGLLDAPVLLAVGSLGWKGPLGMILGYGVAPLVATPAVLRAFRGKPAGLAAMLPLAIFLNTLLVEWAGGFRGVALAR
ncbi:MAG: hypothetical protein K8T20_15305 [Planctomycetes bacterium]|nr:hypothetical protein [Planctomycetota bacterium]